MVWERDYVWQCPDRKGCPNIPAYLQSKLQALAKPASANSAYKRASSCGCQQCKPENQTMTADTTPYNYEQNAHGSLTQSQTSGVGERVGLRRLQNLMLLAPTSTSTDKYRHSQCRSRMKQFITIILTLNLRIQRTAYRWVLLLPLKGCHFTGFNRTPIGSTNWGCTWTS